MKEVRKTVTAVFCDLVGSTELGELLDPETLHEVLSTYYESMAAVVAAEGGRVEKYIGDAVVAVFGVPRAREDDALRAVRAALSMRDAMEKLNARESRRIGMSLKARIGVNTGEVITKELSGEAVVIGDAMNTAARIQTAAPVNGILISGSTFELTANWAIVRAVEPVEVKGKSKPLTVLELLDVLKGSETSRVVDAHPMFGRQTELSHLAQLLAETREGPPLVVCLTGPPGIGKSRLLREFVQQANATFLRMRCRPPGDESRSGGTERLDPDRGLPEIVVLEDAHWADDVEISEILKAFQGSGGPGPLGLLAGRPELTQKLAGVEEIRVVNVPVSPLRDEQIRDLIRSTAGNTELEAMNQIVAASGGNPLHARELARSASVSSEEAVTDGIPKSVRALLSARIDELPANERSLLEHASIIGQSFREGDLTILLKSSEDENSSETMPLISRGILIVAASDAQSANRLLTFENSMIRDIVYESMLKRRRAELHERYARLLMDSDLDVRCEQIASHLISAAEYIPASGEARDRRTELANEAAAILSQSGTGTVLQSRVASNLTFRVVQLIGKPADTTTVSLKRPAAPEKVSLSVERFGEAKSTIDLDPALDGYAVGRLPECEISLTGDPEVSRTHARIFFSHGWWIEDSGSRNGVKVNGEQIDGASRLEPGDRIDLGLTRMVFGGQIA